MSLFDSGISQAVGTAPTLVYTVLNEGTLMQCDLDNSFYGSFSCSVWIQRGAETISLGNSIRVSPKVSTDVVNGRRIVVLAGDTVWAKAPIPNAVSCMVSAYLDLG